MNNSDQNGIETYMVLVNDEEQYSLWPSSKTVPAGWRDIGICGSKARCLEHIEKVWTDITPLGVRNRQVAGSVKLINAI